MDIYMDAAPVEPISPELVLVSPELREQAVALLPDVTWQGLRHAGASPRRPARGRGRLLERFGCYVGFVEPPSS